MVVFAVEFDQFNPEIRADRPHGLFTIGEDLVGEGTTTVFCYEHQVCVTFPNCVSTSAYEVVFIHDTKYTGYVLKRYRFRAYLTVGQEKSCAQLFGCVRVVYNDAVAARENAFRNNEPLVPSSVLSRQLTMSKTTPERAWLAEVSSVPLQQSLQDADRAYTNFFRGLKAKKRVGKPRFKSRRDNRQSARFTKNSCFTVVETTHGVGFATLAKIGRVRFNLSRPLPSEPTSVTIIKEADGQFYLVFVVDVPVTPLAPIGTVCGIDVGLTDFAAIASSDGTREKVTNPRWLHSKERQLARAKKSLSRKQKGSSNRQKARLKVAVLHRKVRETRKDHHHKLALRLVRENQVVAIEGLSIKGLARTRMGKSVHDAGWGQFFNLLEEKAQQYDRTIVRIGQWEPTSQVCSCCGIKDGPKPLSVRVWVCSHCGAKLDRDYNAAVNIMLAAGLAESLNACGGNVRLRLAEAVPVEAGTHRTDLRTIQAA